MDEQFSVPEEYEASYRRILPYLMAPLQKDPQILVSLLLYLKLGGEKMARIVIDALNVTQRLQDAEIKRQLREQEFSNDNGREDLEDDDEGNDDEEDEADADDDLTDRSG
jgi:hypothetical protein